jgi:hypothetical protein
MRKREVLSSWLPLRDWDFEAVALRAHERWAARYASRIVILLLKVLG